MLDGLETPVGESDVLNVLPATGGVGQPVARDDRGDQSRDADEDGVDGEDLREESATAHQNGVHVIGRMGLRLMRRSPHASLYFVKY